jgi:dihydroorotate dehydrogenase
MYSAQKSNKWGILFRVCLLSLIYRVVRRVVICVVYGIQRIKGQQRDLEDVVLYGNQKLKEIDSYMGWLAYNFPIPQRIGVHLYDLYFPSPLTLASFKDDLKVVEIWLRQGLGGATLKTILKEPSTGNPRPRLQEIILDGETGLINALGLPGEGVAGLIQSLRGSPLFTYGRPIGISIGGHTISEYQDNFLELHRFLSSLGDIPYYFELNISCPNTPHGQDMTKFPHLLESLLQFMRKHSDDVIGAKLSPDQSNQDLMVFAELIRSVEKTYINVGNAPYRKCSDVGLPEEAISIGGGGQSGPGIFKRTLEMATLLSPMKVPILATGGISTVSQVKALQDKGVLLMGMATAVVQDPYCIPRINRALALA